LKIVVPKAPWSVRRLTDLTPPSSRGSCPAPGLRNGLAWLAGRYESGNCKAASSPSTDGHSKALRAFSWFLGARQPTGMSDCTEKTQSEIAVWRLTDRNDSLSGITGGRCAKLETNYVGSGSTCVRWLEIPIIFATETTPLRGEKNRCRRETFTCNNSNESTPGLVTVVDRMVVEVGNHGVAVATPWLPAAALRQLADPTERAPATSSLLPNATG
jgi:hypothetical protein